MAVSLTIGKMHDVQPSESGAACCWMDGKTHRLRRRARIPAPRRLKNQIGTKKKPVRGNSVPVFVCRRPFGQRLPLCVSPVPAAAGEGSPEGQVPLALPALDPALRGAGPPQRAEPPGSAVLRLLANLAAVILRLAASDFLKNPREINRVGNADPLGDFISFQGGRAQKGLRLLDPHTLYIGT